MTLMERTMLRPARTGALVLDPRWPGIRKRLESTTQKEWPLSRAAAEINLEAVRTCETFVTPERLRTAMQRDGVQRKLSEYGAAPVRVSFVCARAHAQCGRVYLLPGYTYVVEPLPDLPKGME